LAVVHNIPEHGTIKIVPGLFNLTHVNNPGAAWGILAGYGWLLLAVSVLVLCGVVFYMRKLTEGWAERYFALGMIASGIIGNSIDRVWRGEVVDFLDFYYDSMGHWPSFNVADSAITAGVAIFIISSFFRPQRKSVSELQIN
jgi:signal peptidase II